MKILRILFQRKLVLLMFFSGFLYGCESEDNENVKTNKTSGAIPFSVMSFNVRHHNDDDPQSLKIRKAHILKTITKNTPDIVGLQEFSTNWFETWMAAQMESIGYDSYINASAGIGSPKAIFYKSNRFTRLKQATFQMNYTEPRSGTWVILYDHLNDQKYFISNSHWTTFSPGEREKSAKKVISVVREKYQGLPIVIFGDFNAQPRTRAIQIIGEAENLYLKSAHEENLNTFHGWDAVGSSKLDWIFYSNNSLTVTKSEVIETSYDGYWSSDHWPIMATFQLIE